ncbi:MAG: carbohydrate-binding family 9-like protein [Archangium sp.]|nr:carbohydrate-binding family 9-like protein [Archangium sp.]MDP3571582.1 carbohydrate-binding family 9-like protein [Archangium sp.]
MRLIRLSLVVVLALAGCRDEQAGPKPKAPRGPAPAPVQGGQVRVLDAPPASFTHSSGATWAGGAVTYLGSIVEPARPKAGDQVQLRHYFRADGAVNGQWRFFMHVMDETTRQQVGNLDHELQNGAAPLGSWPRGKIIEDVHGFQMPAIQGSLRLFLGFWSDSGRLPIDTAALSDGDGRVLGPKLEAPGQVALPEYSMVRAAKAPVIDGKLDDAVWQTAKEQPLTRSYDGGPITRKTTFRMVYDDAFLYVAFRAEDPDVWGSLRNKDDSIYNEDVVEVFLDADADGKTYNELQVSPHNVNFDASFVARRSDLPTAMKWESGMKSAVFVKGTLDDDSDTDEYWTAEMQIPIANLTSVPHVPPVKGDRWRFNAYRLEHIARRTNIEGQSFSPLFVGDFHALPRFGWLVFE